VRLLAALIIADGKISHQTLIRRTYVRRQQLQVYAFEVSIPDSFRANHTQPSTIHERARKCSIDSVTLSMTRVFVIERRHYSQVTRDQCIRSDRTALI
jgi:hypothetical protein